MIEFSSEPKVTRDKVFAAADQLFNAGDKPTMVKVKDILGGGSFSTISPLLGEWKESKRQATTIVKAPLPESVSRALSQVADQVWSAAQEESEKSVAGEREALHAASVELAEREAELLDAIRSNELDIRTLTEKLEANSRAAAEFADKSAQDHAVLASNIESLKVDNAKLEEHSRSLEALGDERKQQLVSANQEITGLQAKIEGLRTERETLDRTVADLRHEIQGKNAEIKRLGDAFELMKSEIGLMKQDIDSERAEKQALSAQIKTEQEKNASVAERSAGLEKLLAQMQEQLDKERKRCDNLQAEIILIAKEKQKPNGNEQTK